MIWVTLSQDIMGRGFFDWNPVSRNGKGMLLWACSISHISQKARDTPDFLQAAVDTTACAPFFKERRMKVAKGSKLHRKSGIWGTHGIGSAQKKRSCKGVLE